MKNVLMWEMFWNLVLLDLAKAAMEQDAPTTSQHLGRW